MKLPAAVSALVIVAGLTATAGAQVINGSFEGGLASWTVNGGVGAAATTAVADDLFPSAGASYLVLNTNGNGPTAGGYGPHVGGCGQVTQVVFRDGREFCSLSVDWEFLPTEALPDGFYNDWFSIDVINHGTGALITNVVYIDTGTGAGAPPYTNVPGAGAGVLTYVPNQATAFFATGNQAPAGFKRALVDLSGVAAGTAMRIEISISNQGDSAFQSRAYVDRVRISGGQQNYNTGTAALRVLGSSHQDGYFNFDWSDDVLAMAPYTLRTCPGQRLSFRARGAAGSKWAMVAGNLLDPGVSTPFGQINVDVFSAAPFSFPINGFTTDPVQAWIGTITYDTNWIDAQIPEATPLGTSITVQAGMEQGPGGPLAVCAATTIEVGAPQIPIGAVIIPGGAQGDDGSTNQPFAGFGAGTWPFYAVARASVDVNSNGNVTFGGGSGDFTESESEMLTGPARIAPVWDDLYPPGGGVVRSTTTASTHTVSWTAMEEFLSGLQGNNFSVQLYQANQSTPAGVFTIYYGSSTMDDGLSGISPGGLPAPAPNAVSSNVNWTSLGASLGARVAIPAGTHRFERFAAADNGLLRDTFDLMSIGGVSRITFVPNGAGYTYFVGTR